MIKDEKLDEPRITGVTKDEVVLFEVSVPKGIQGHRWMVDLAQAGVKVKMLSCTASGKRETCTLAVSKEDEDLTADALRDALRTLPQASCSRGGSMARVSLVGYGVGDSPSIVADFLDVFDRLRAPVRSLQVSSLRLSCITAKREAGRVVKGLAEKYNLLE